jgi:uncharacterized membrane protein
VFGVLVNLRPDQNPIQSQTPVVVEAPAGRRREKVTFTQDFRQFFLRGLAALLPTLITLWLLVWAWNFLWESLGRHLIWAMKYAWGNLAGKWVIPDAPSWGFIDHYWDERNFSTRLFGVLLAVLSVYIVGFFVGNLIGRTFWKLGENLVMKIPIIRAIYPAVKQVTDFLLADRSHQFEFSRVVAVQPHEKGIWSIGLVTGQGLRPLAETTGQEMLTVFVPSSPTAFSGYVLVAPRNEVVELPITVEEAMRLLISGGVIVPGSELVPGGGEESAIAELTQPTATPRTPPQPQAKAS